MSGLVFSSSPVDGHHPSRPFLGRALQLPSSPGPGYETGEISPGFDASFQSSMSIGNDNDNSTTTSRLASTNSFIRSNLSEPSPMQLSSPIAGPSSCPRSSLGFDSPSGVGPSSATLKPTTKGASTAKENYPFLAQLFSKDGSSPKQPLSAPPGVTTFPHLTRPGASVLGPSHAGNSASSTAATIRLAPIRPLFSHAKSAGNGGDGLDMGAIKSREFHFSAAGSARRDPMFSTGGSSPSSSDAEQDHEVDGPMNPPRHPSAARNRKPLPTGWAAKAKAGPNGGLRPPHVGKSKRASEPIVPTFLAQLESSPPRMEVDGSSPGMSSPTVHRPRDHPRAISDPAMSHFTETFLDDVPSSDGTEPESDSAPTDRLADLFADSLSPIPQSRKRFLDIDLSPTPASPSPAISQVAASGLAPRRTMERASTTACLPHVARRRASAMTLNKRSSAIGLPTLAVPAPSHGCHKRHAQDANGKPSAPTKTWRRAYSVADAAIAVGSLSTHDTVPSVEVTCPPANDYFGHQRGVTSVDMSPLEAPRMPSPAHSPTTGFRRQETKGKALPCFQVKEDGLMRITPETLNGLQSGDYAEGIHRFLIIDCRFDYEFNGGHITDAINLSSPAEVEKALLTGEGLPKPSTSEEGTREGKTVLIFHCEYSKERAPTSAKHLRNQDRHLNAAVYPQIHYPEVYVLQGGFKTFYERFPRQCVGVYRPMNDVAHKKQLDVDMASFRNQKRQFARASSFTYGQGQAAAAVMAGSVHAQATVQPLALKNANARPAGPPRAGSKKHLQAPITLAQSDFRFPASRPKGLMGLASHSTGHVPTLVKSSSGMSITEEEQDQADSSFGTVGSSPCGGAGDSPCPPGSKLGRHSLRMSAELGRPAGPRTFGRAQTSSILMFTR